MPFDVVSTQDLGFPNSAFNFALTDRAGHRVLGSWDLHGSGTTKFKPLGPRIPFDHCYPTSWSPATKSANAIEWHWSFPYHATDMTTAVRQESDRCFKLARAISKSCLRHAVSLAILLQAPFIDHINVPQQLTTALTRTRTYSVNLPVRNNARTQRISWIQVINYQCGNPR